MTTPFRQGMRRILADRHGPEAAALYQTLLTVVHRRVVGQARTRWGGVLGEPDHEEILGEVLFQLMQGGLARFRGDTLPELLAFVRTMTDRITWRVVERRLRERDAVRDMVNGTVPAWRPDTVTQPDVTDVIVESPLPEADRVYLDALIMAGSRAELARTLNVSRAAVTQRIQRIRDRVAALPTDQRATHEAWLRRRASEALDRGDVAAGRPGG